MKKVLVLSAFGLFGVLAFSSCKKTYNCVCTGQGASTGQGAITAKGKSATDACNDAEITVLGITTEECIPA